jgi:hypothetical protein
VWARRTVLQTVTKAWGEATLLLDRLARSVSMETAAASVALWEAWPVLELVAMSACPYREIVFVSAFVSAGAGAWVELKEIAGRA